MKTRSRTWSALLVASALVFAACGSDDSSDGAPSADTSGGSDSTEPVATIETEVESTDAAAPAELTDVKVGSIPIFNNALLFTAIDQGFFEEEGLNVELVPSTNFGAGLAAVLNGENQFSFASSVPVISAASGGAPITWVSGAEVISSSTTLDDSPDAVVTDDESIVGVLDLQGKTVAVNALNVINTLAIETSIRELGGDPGAVNFVEIPYPEMLGTLEGGEVDAVAIVEPFVTAARAADLTLVEGALWSDGLPDGALIDGYFTSQALAEDDPQLVAAFARAIDRAAEFATNDLPAVRSLILDFVNTDEATAQAANFYDYNSTVTPEQIAELSALMLEAGYIDEELDPASIVVTD